MTRVLLSVLGALLLTGCGTLSYYGKGLAGQARFYGARVPIEDVLARADLPADVRRRLEMVPEVRRFAREELRLPIRGQYRDYVQLREPYVAWSVFAAPELSLQPYRWCYFFRTLCVEYRGYFSAADAHAYAARLAERGYDTYVGGVAAFSTLGMLDDPVTSVLTAYPDDLLALVLFHELAHVALYVDDDTAFNESFAQAVAEEGLRRWLAARAAAARAGVPAGPDPELARIRAGQDLLVSVALAAREQLRAVYASDAPPAEQRRRKVDILAAATADYRTRCTALGDGCPHADWFGTGLNNARLNAVATYEHWVPAFTALLRAHARPDGRPGADLEAFYRTVTALGELPRRERDAVLQALMPVPENAP